MGRRKRIPENQKSKSSDRLIRDGDTGEYGSRCKAEREEESGSSKHAIIGENSLDVGLS